MHLEANVVDLDDNKALLPRLRTHYVDINAQGFKCREKQSRVLWEIHELREKSMEVGLKLAEYADFEQVKQMLQSRKQSLEKIK
mmetsp:Transcript_4816/g.6852  ORF Transcript_4816/g.6852 Transcript_4816/m.6852 type:complete len:84 (+) Transcript_4816:1021-1272(+)